MPFDSILDTASAGAALAPLDWQAVLAGDHPARVPLLAPILAPGELALLRGPAGIGKSWLALQLAFAVAQGQADVLGWRTGGEGRRVLFVDAQLARPELKRRLGAVAAAAARKPAGTLHLLSGDGHALPDLATAEGRAAFAALVRGYDLVVLDGMALPDGAAFAPWWAALRRVGPALLVVAAGRGRSLARLEDAADVVLALARPKGYEADEGVRFELRLAKARAVHGPAAAPFEASLDAAFRWTRESLRPATPAEAWALHGRGLSVRAIAARLGLSKSKVHRWLMAREHANRRRLHAALMRVRARRAAAGPAPTDAVPTVPTGPSDVGPAGAVPVVPPAAVPAVPPDAVPAAAVPPVPSVPAVPPAGPAQGLDFDFLLPPTPRAARLGAVPDVPALFAETGWTWATLEPWLRHELGETAPFDGAVTELSDRPAT